MIDKSKFIPVKYEDLYPASIRELTEAGILNGYGGARQSWIVRWMIGRLLSKFSLATPSRHDYGYWL